MVAGVREWEFSSHSIVTESENSLTLQEALQTLGGDPPADIPFLVWLLENPASPLALPGKIDLHGHDCLHVLLGRHFSLYDEAFIVGFTMGNDRQTHWFHLLIFKLFARWFYPTKYRFQKDHFIAFELGFLFGKKVVQVKELNQFPFRDCLHQSLTHLRTQFGIDPNSLSTLRQTEALLIDS